MHRKRVAPGLAIDRGPRLQAVDGGRLVLQMNGGIARREVVRVELNRRFSWRCVGGARPARREAAQPRLDPEERLGMSHHLRDRNGPRVEGVQSEPLQLIFLDRVPSHRDDRAVEVGHACREPLGRAVDDQQ